MGDYQEKVSEKIKAKDKNTKFLEIFRKLDATQKISLSLLLFILVSLPLSIILAGSQTFFSPRAKRPVTSPATPSSTPFPTPYSCLADGNRCRRDDQCCSGSCERKYLVFKYCADTVPTPTPTYTPVPISPTPAPTETATATIKPESGNYTVGDTIDLGVYFNPMGVVINGVALRLTYPFSGLTPEVIVTSIEVNPSLSSSGDWSCPVQNSDILGDTVIVNVACTNTSAEGFTSSVDTLLANVKLNITQVPKILPFVIKFDKINSVIYRKSDNQNILLEPTSEGSYYIREAQVTVTPTPTAFVTNTPTPTWIMQTPTPTLAPIPTTPTPTPTPKPTHCFLFWCW